MKNITSAVLGFALMTGAAGLTFAQDASKKVEDKSTATTTTTKTTKVKKHKKAAKPADANTATPPAAK